MKDREDLLDEIIGVNRQVEAVSVMLRHLLRANQKTGEYTNTDVICQVLLAIEDMSDRIDTAATKLADGQQKHARDQKDRFSPNRPQVQELGAE